MKAPIFGVLAVIAAILIKSSIFIVQEGEQALITQFGRIVGKPITEAGLQVKMPFIQEVRYFEKRIIAWDGDPNQIPTKDKKYIWVDTTARWRISDLVKFAQTVRTENGAQDRLNSILDGATRDVISNHNLVEAVRDSNAILDRINEVKKEREAKAKATEEAAAKPETPGEVPVGLALETIEDVEIEEQVTGEIERVRVGREKLSTMIIERAKENLETLGIQLIDVQLRRIAYEQSVEAKVYDRMVSERNRIAERIRSIGKGEQAKIQGKLNKDLKEIESAAYRQSQEIRGKGEAQAIAIYAGSLGQDAQFYRFVRSMEAYKKTMGKDNNIILSTDSEFLQFLR